MDDLIICLVLAVCLFHLNTALAVCLDDLSQRAMLTGAKVGTVESSVNCKLQGSTRPPAFSKDGDFIIGGTFSLHSYTQTAYNKYTNMPTPVKCKGRLVSGRRGCYKHVGLCKIKNVFTCMMIHGI